MIDTMTRVVRHFENNPPEDPRIRDRIKRLSDAARTEAQLNALREQADDLRAMIGMDECLRRQH